LGGHLEACRFVWNLFLEALDKYHADNWNNWKKGLTALDTMKPPAQLKKKYKRVRDARTDFNRKASTAMAKHYGTVLIEDLNIRCMQGNHHLARGITDQGWHRFADLLGYRLKWRGE